jgi:hypothetical protein
MHGVTAWNGGTTTEARPCRLCLRPNRQRRVSTSESSNWPIWSMHYERAALFRGLKRMRSKNQRRSYANRLKNDTLPCGKGSVDANDLPLCLQAGDLMASRQKKGRPGDLRDTMIAGIVLAHHSRLATRNIPHFEDFSVPIINPWLA